MIIVVHIWITLMVPVKIYLLRNQKSLHKHNDAFNITNSIIVGS